MNESKKDAIVYNSSMKWFYSIRESIENQQFLGIETNSFEDKLKDVLQQKHLRVIMEFYE